MNEKTKILIVDDLKDNRLVLKIAFKNENYILYEATNGKEAIEKCQELEPDVVLMDAIMPVMDGYDATKFIRTIKKFDRMPILMITALSDKSDMIKALECGANDFITKPFDKHELIARCKSYANLSKINKQYVLATKNPTTNLPNKLALMRDIKSCINPKLTLFVIEDYELLENFYNEDVAGNIVKQFAKQIMDLVSDDCRDGSLYHINEGEFSILKDDPEEIISGERAYKNCQELIQNCKKSKIVLDGYEYRISLILSYSMAKNHIFENARIGLNNAIKEKKDIVFADEIVECVHKEAVNNLKIIKMVEIALSQDKVISCFQPLFNNKTKKIEKYESLVRIIDENDLLVSPYVFLDISKKGRYYTHITKRVLKNSFDVLKKTKKDISINISAIDIEEISIKNTILDFCKNNSQFAKRIVFEFLEDENFKDFNSIVEFINEIKSYGSKIAIDDFGSGYSSFERLMEFKPDILKIDGSLIKNIDKDKFSKNIVETIQDFATKMNIETVAEFVHNKDIFEIVNKIGITYTQGYYIGKPEMSID